MNEIKPNSNMKRIEVLLLILLIINSLTSNFIYSNNSKDKTSLNAENGSKIKIQPKSDDLYSSNYFNLPKIDYKTTENWKEKIQKVDQNNNGISDKFENRINNLKRNYELSLNSTEPMNYNHLSIETDEIQSFLFDRVPILIQFPYDDYSYAISIFKNLGGTIKTNYLHAITGFAGEIGYANFNNFTDKLNDENYPFLIEEDLIVEANLYYASRNMNLRPYVWNNLSFNGDNYSSIAIIDTGIDDSHNFFDSGYSNGNFNYKIVGWNDEVNGYSTPYDDNGHGSHCAGIAAGQGEPNLDGNGRTVSTYAFSFDDTGDYWEEEDDFNITAAVFNVTTSGNIDIICDFEDFTPDIDQVHISPYLLYEDTLVDYIVSSLDSWTENLSYSVTFNEIGTYTLILAVDFDDNDGDDEIWDPYMRIRTEIHWPFNPPLYSSGDPWKGIAPDTHLVAVKVLDEHGSGYASDIIDGIDWVIANKEIYNITVISMSLGGMGGMVSMIDAVNNAVENGIVTVVAAGNSGGNDENEIGSPGDADNVITVGASSIIDKITEYSSSGGLSHTGFTIKPDILAPGGSWINLTMFSTDTNDNDAEGEYSTDSYPNDMYPAVGTSMATPAVAGAANLLIEAMGGHKNWNYSAEEAKIVKSLLLMTATETYPLNREENPIFSAELNRGGKDRQEGYGRINVDAAIEAIINELEPKSYNSGFLTSSLIDPFKKHALACYVKLNASENYKFFLDVPNGVDFDLYCYNSSASSIGEPIMLASSNSSVLGEDEYFSYTPQNSERFILVAKAISGQGLANISFLTNDFIPLLNGEDVSPSTGNQSTLLNFIVNYTDPDNIKPSYVNLLINNTCYGMIQQDINDKNYSDGTIYQYLIYLQPGTYNYSFLAKDGRFVISTTIYTGLNIDKTNLATPILKDGQVNSYKGLVNITEFVFTVNYSDPDNNAPNYLNITLNNLNYTMSKSDSLDFNYMDGSLYFLKLIINMSMYCNYTFLTFDSDNYFTLGPFYGPVVCTKKNLFSEDFESGTLIKWNEISGLWHLTGSDSRWPNSYHSPTHSMWYGQESTGTYNTGGWTLGYLDSNPIDLSTEEEAFLEYYYWMEGDEYLDVFAIYISTDYEDWDVLYYTVANVNPWEKITLNITNYCGYSSVWIQFFFTNFYPFNPGDDDYRGFLLDDILIYSWLEPNNFAPALTYENLDPITGDQITKLNFSVIYTDMDNNAPNYINVVVNGSSYPMQKANIDNNYYDGCIYLAYIFLQPGIYFYSFECADYKYINSTRIYSGLIITEKLNSNSPILNNGYVTPLKGCQGTTIFSFSVNYTDFDNNPPVIINIIINSTQYSLIKQNAYDTNFMDGCKYVFNTTLWNLGTYVFYFNCTDGDYTAYTGLYMGPLVIVNYGLINYKMITGYNFNWIDASPASGGICCDMAYEDDENQYFHLPFIYQFYNKFFDFIYVSTNGYGIFENKIYISPVDFPSSSRDLMIAPFFSDLETRNPCNIFVRNMTNPNRVVISWINIDYWGGPEAGSFQIVLFENGDILFNFYNITFIDEDEGYTCGLNYGDGTHYNMYRGLYAGLNNYSILFIYEPAVFLSSDDGGGGGDGKKEQIILGFNLFILIGIIFGSIAMISLILLKKRKSLS